VYRHPTSTAVAIAVALGVLVCSSSALAVRSGGHNPPTRKLEVAFKVAGGARAGRKDGCYPAPRRMAALIHHWGHLESAVTPGLGSVDSPGVAYVLRRGASCGHLRFALRDRGRLFILDTLGGEVFVQGSGGRQEQESRRLGRGPLRQLSLVSRAFGLGKPDRARRLLVRCPRGTSPLGGGLSSYPAVGDDGEGVYPHSYERLGVQRGYHVTALIIDPTPASTTPRSSTIQVICGRGLVPTSSPHRTVFVRRGETNSAVAGCPPGQYLFSGGFQRTNFTTPFRTYGGNYITESRAISPTAWRVAATSAGWDGGELTAIAYCVRSPGPLITEVSGSTPVAGGESATATTPQCPAGLELTSGGFSLNGSQNAFFAGGALGDDGSWSATGFGYLGPAPSLSAYGYCLDALD
jgi:hypothetical protein